MKKIKETLRWDIKDIIKELKDKTYIVIINKKDLESKINLEELDINKDNVIYTNMLKQEGIEELKQKIIELFNLGNIENSDPTYLSNARSIGILESCLESIKEVEKGLGNNEPIDMIELDIKDIWEKLGTINGTTYEEELLDEMFSRFCLGK